MMGREVHAVQHSFCKRLRGKKAMDIEVSFPGGKRVDAKVGDHVLRTDQPHTNGGGNAAPSPFDLFLASVATCAGIYVLGFCQARGISMDGITLRQRVNYDAATKLPSNIRLELGLPASFPEQHRSAVVQAATSCKVKKTMAAQPSVEVVAVRTSVAMWELGALPA
jgi:putative redox protein